MRFRCTVDGAAELKRQWRSEARDLRSDLAREAYRAAKAGVMTAKAEHPYTDRTGELTGTSGVETTVSFDAAMVLMKWPAYYASFVNSGTRHAKPYPFATPAAKYTANQLDTRSRARLARFLAAFAGK